MKHHGSNKFSFKSFSILILLLGIFCNSLYCFGTEDKDIIGTDPTEFLKSGEKLFQKLDSFQLAEARDNNGNYLKSNYETMYGNDKEEVLSRCYSAFKDALTWCNEKNGAIADWAGENGKTALTAATAVSDVAGMMSGMFGSCNAFGKMLMGLQGAIAGFRMYCAHVKTVCVEQCSGISAILKKDREAINNIKEDQKGEDRKIQIAEAKKEAINWIDSVTSRAEKGASIRDYLQICKDNSESIKAAQNLMMVGQNLMQSQNCAKEAAALTATDVCTSNPQLPGCAANAAVDCSLSTNFSNIACICQRNPNDPTCPNANLSHQKTASLNGSSSTDLSSLLNKKPNTSNDSSSNGDGTYPFDPNGKSSASKSSSAGISPGGGGGGVGGNGSSANNGGGQSGGNGEQSSNFNTDIFRGYGGAGAGGGVSSYGSSNDYSRSKYRKPSSTDYKAYLPGGKLDPLKVKLQSLSKDGMTGAGGPSLFEKVGRRYRDDRGTLLPE